MANFALGAGSFLQGLTGGIQAGQQLQAQRQQMELQKRAAAMQEAQSFINLLKLPPNLRKPAAKLLFQNYDFDPQKNEQAKGLIDLMVAAEDDQAKFMAGMVADLGKDGVSLVNALKSGAITAPQFLEEANKKRALQLQQSRQEAALQLVGGGQPSSGAESPSSDSAGGLPPLNPTQQQSNRNILQASETGYKGLIARRDDLLNRIKASVALGDEGGDVRASLNAELKTVQGKIEREERIQDQYRKPIPLAMAQALQVPVGTPLSAVAGQVPMRTKADRDAIAQLSFFRHAEEDITRLIEQAKADPTLFGLTGSLRAKGQNALGILEDFGLEGTIDAGRTALAFLAPGQEYENLRQELFGNPTLSALDLLENSLGLTLARARNPEGRIPVDVIRRSISDVKLRGFQSNERVLNRLNEIQRQFTRAATDQENSMGGTWPKSEESRAQTRPKISQTKDTYEKMSLEDLRSFVETTPIVVLDTLPAEVSDFISERLKSGNGQ